MLLACTADLTDHVCITHTCLFCSPRDSGLPPGRPGSEGVFPRESAQSVVARRSGLEKLIQEEVGRHDDVCGGRRTGGPHSRSSTVGWNRVWKTAGAVT